MFRQDFIMRQIRQFTEGLQRVIAKKKKGEEQEAQDLIEQFLTDVQDDEHRKFYTLSLAETVSALNNDDDFNAELALAVADLLFEKGQITEDDISTTSYKQALVLYKKAMNNPEVAFPLEAMQKIEKIKGALDSSSIEKVKQVLE